MFCRLCVAHTFQLTTCSIYNRLTGPRESPSPGTFPFHRWINVRKLAPNLLGLQYNSASKRVSFLLRQSTTHLPPLPKPVRTNPASPFPLPLLPAKVSFRFRQHQRGDGVFHQVSHHWVLGCHVEEGSPRAVVDRAIANGQAAPKGQSLDLTNVTIMTKRLFSGRAMGNTNWGKTLCCQAGNTALGPCLDQWIWQVD